MTAPAAEPKTASKDAEGTKASNKGGNSRRDGQRRNDRGERGERGERSPAVSAAVKAAKVAVTSAKTTNNWQPAKPMHRANW